MSTVNLENMQYDCNQQPLMYGDRVRFHWVDEWYENNIELVCGGEYGLEGLYSGKYEGQTATGAELANVTVVTKGEFRGKTLCPYPHDLEIVSHLHYKISQNMEKNKKTRNYDRIALMELRDSIMDNFEFDRVAKTMKVLKWGWASNDPDENMQIPDEGRIRREARSLIDHLINTIGTDKEIHSVSTGGFTVEFDEIDGIPNLSLKFVVDEWEDGYDSWEELYQKGLEERKKEGYPMLPVNPNPEED